MGAERTLFDKGIYLGIAFKKIVLTQFIWLEIDKAHPTKVNQNPQPLSRQHKLDKEKNKLQKQNY